MWPMGLLFAIASSKKDWAWYILNVRMVLWNYICMLAWTHFLQDVFITEHWSFFRNQCQHLYHSHSQSHNPYLLRGRKGRKGISVFVTAFCFLKREVIFFHLSIWQSVDQMLSTQCLYPLLDGLWLLENRWIDELIIRSNGQRSYCWSKDHPFLLDCILTWYISSPLESDGFKFNIKQLFCKL